MDQATVARWQDDFMQTLATKDFINGSNFDAPMKKPITNIGRLRRLRSFFVLNEDSSKMPLEFFGRLRDDVSVSAVFVLPSVCRKDVILTGRSRTNEHLVGKRKPSDNKNIG